MYCNPDNFADFTPVDVCIKAMIIAAWKRAHEPQGTLPVINCASSNIVSIRIGQVTDIGKSLSAMTPFDQMLWTPGGCTTLNRPVNYLKTIFYQLLPALLIDMVFRMKGQRPL
jgi:alcohol-forming fatty acyl-CoA reductase